MRANHLRNRTFSLGNSTLNRIEANRCQLKAMARDIISIDRCVQSIWHHQMTVLRSVQTSVQFSQARTKLSTLTPHFMTHPLLDQSPYTSKKILQQRKLHVKIWDSVAWCQDMHSGTANTFTLCASLLRCDRQPPTHPHGHVDALFSSHHLRFLHLFYTCRDVLLMKQYPSIIGGKWVNRQLSCYNWPQL